MTLRLILGDQLNIQHSWYKDVDQEVVYVMMEIRQETDYVQHHIQKIIAFFGAMRHFSNALKENGHKVVYYQLDHPENTQSLTDNLDHLLRKYQAQKLEYQLPDEFRLDEQLVTFCRALSIETKAYDSEHFLGKRMELEEFFEGKKSYLMESYYRYMRKEYDVLMDGEDPINGQWNYDKENRKKIPIDHPVPDPITFSYDVNEILEMIEETDISYFGKINSNEFIWPLTYEDSIEILDYFIQHLLPHFGDFQDALHPEEWSLYHSRLSFAMNSKMLSPIEVIRKAEQAYHDGRRNIEINQVEGFIRQILGWREYMRGIYWAKMPEFKNLNFFNHQRKLPEWFWTGKTKMKCLSHAINQSLEYAYAHHIQRLMITGNFALLAGIDPDELDEWYLGIYIDAIEWVEITNTRGMSQYADGGIVGTKPYVSSANYIDKMGHYCSECHYSKSKKIGKNSCPFNSLYWHFYARNEDKLAKNPRIGMMYNTWRRMSQEKQHAYLEQAESYLSQIEQL